MAGKNVGVGVGARKKIGTSVDPDDPYPMNLPKLGHAVIVNNVAKEMPGSMEDVKALEAAFRTVGFDVEIHTNMSKITEMAGKNVGVGVGARKKIGTSVDPDVPYSMNLPKLGHAVIVNNVAKEMSGSMEDVKALEAAFRTIGFNVEVHTNMSKSEMSRLEDDILNNKKHQNSNCFIMVIICHGNNKGQLKDVNKRKAWDIEELIGDLSKVETLMGKPKIMILQCCRGGQTNVGRPAVAGTLAEDEEVTKPQIVADKADFYVAYATVPGYTAFVGGEHRSEYLQSLATLLKENYKEKPLDRIYLMVKQHMGKTSQGEQQIRQCSEVRDSLTRVLHFGPFHGVEISKEKSQQEEIEMLKKQMEEQKREMEREMNEMRQKMEKMTSPVAEKPEVQMKALSGTKKPEDSKRTGQSTFYKAGSRSVEMKVISTHAINLFRHHSMTVVKETGQIVISGMIDDHSAVILVFALQGKNLKQKKVIKPLCKYDYPSKVQSINTPSGEQLALLCSYCNEIKLLDLRTQKVTIAFKIDVPEMICYGDQNIVYVVSRNPKSWYQHVIAELDCSEIPFKRLGFYPLEDSDYKRLCYAPSPYKLLVTGNTYRTDAISYDKNERVWTLNTHQEYPKKRLAPQGVAFSIRHSSIFLCDGSNKRILVIDPNDGSYFQTVDLPDLGFIYDLCPHDGKFIILSCQYPGYYLSYVSVN